MISPRGLILPQLPLGGWNHNDKERAKTSYSQKGKSRVKIKVHDTLTDTWETITAQEFVQRYNKNNADKIQYASLHRAKQQGNLFAKRYRIYKAEKLQSNYMVKNVKTGERKNGSILVLCEIINCSRPTFYRYSQHGKVFKKEWRIIRI